MSEEIQKTNEQLVRLAEIVAALSSHTGDWSVQLQKLNEDAQSAGKAIEDATKRIPKDIEGIGKSFGDMLNTFTGGGTKYSELITSMNKDTQNFGDVLGKLGKGFGGVTKGLTFAGAAAGVAMMAFQVLTAATIKMALSVDNAMVSFNKSTGASRKYGDMMLSLEAQHRSNQISMDDLAGTMEGLISNFGAVNFMAYEQQRAFAENTMILQELGVSAENTASNLNLLVTGLGMSAEAANKVQNEMFVLAQQIGMSPNSMSAAFSEAMPKLAAFGKNAPEVFKKLQVNAQKAGMSMNDILSITEKFDRFDSAAESVGKLNAILGGPYMSVTKMIKATDPTDRMRILSQATREAGKSFDSMAYYERKALAAAMGLEDVSQLALVMNNRFDLLAPTTQKSAAELEALALQTAEFNSVAEVFTSTLQQLIANLGPAVKGFKNMIGVVGTLTASFPVLKLGIAGVAMAVTAAAVAIMIAMGSTGIGGIIVIIGVIVTGFTAASGAIYSFLGSWKDLVSEMSGAQGAMGYIMAFLKFTAVAMMPIVGLVWALVQVFSHWQEIMEFVVFNLGDLVGQFAAVTDRASALTAGSSAATQSFIEWGDVLEWVGTYIYFAGQQMLTLYDAIVTLAEGAMWVWNNFTVLRYGIYTLAAAVGIIVGVFVGLVALPYLISAGVMYLLQRFKLLKPILIIIGVVTGILAAVLLSIPILITAIVGGLVYLAYTMAKYTYPWVKKVIDVFSAFQSIGLAIAKWAAAPIFNKLQKDFDDFAKKITPVYDMFVKMGEVVRDFKDEIKLMSKQFAESMEELQPYLDTLEAITNPGQAVMNYTLGPDASQNIADATFSKASSMASGNKDLQNAINKLATAVGADSDSNVTVELTGDMKNLFKTLQAQTNRLASGLPTFGNS